MIAGIRMLIAAGVLASFAAGGTWYRYGSLDACDWLAEDMASESALPRVLIEARIRAQFLLDGITEPDFGDCLRGWWSYRLEDLPAGE